MDNDDFVRRIAMYLLNSLACQVDGHQKQLVGDLGAIVVSLFHTFFSRRTTPSDVTEALQLFPR